MPARDGLPRGSGIVSIREWASNSDRNTRLRLGTLPAAVCRPVSGKVSLCQEEVPERKTTPDAKYNSELVAKFINAIMRDGKKSTAEAILYDALDTMERKAKESPLKLFEQAVDNVKPKIEVKSRRVGGSTYQVPTEIRPSRRTALGIRWIISFARKRGEKSMADKLAGELLDAANKRGASIKKKEDTHKMAEANKAFAHFRW